MTHTNLETFKNLEESADLGEYMKVKFLKVFQLEKEELLVITLPTIRQRIMDLGLKVK